MRNRRLVVTCVTALSALVLSALAIPALAVSTRVFELDDVPSFTAGDMDRTSVRSDGTVRSGVELRRIAMTNVPLAYRFVRAQDGTVYVGTGNDGKIFKLSGGALTQFADTQQLLVSALAIGDGGVLYAGTLPEGRVYTIQPSGLMRELVRPPGAEHVWALEWDARRHTLFAATGPEGKVFAIDRAGRADVYWDSQASHVMSLALDVDGTLYAGTSDDALVVRLRAPGRAEVVWDFPGNEITALDVSHGTLAVAANDFPDPPSASVPTKAPPTVSASGGSPTTTRPRAGKGKLFRVGADGRAEEVFANDDAQLTSVQLAPDGTIYAGSGKDGRIYRVDPDRSSATWIDVDERQVLGIDLVGPSPMFVTGDPGAVYQVVAGPARNGTWTSKPLDARFVSRWGELTWRADGAVHVETRSGNTEHADDTSWSAWSAALAQPGPIRSPASRFLQVRVRFDGDPNAVLRAVQVYYLPQNQRAVVRDVAVTAPEASPTADTPRAATTVQKLTWKVDNTDADRLRFRIRFRAESQTAWRDMLRESETHTRTDYSWETNGVPDGWYRVRVEASDELATPERFVLRTTADSAPILVDNHAPRIEGLRVAGGHLQGRVVDSVGPIAKLEYAVDGGEWRMFFPSDDLLDTADEAFDLDPGALTPGSHIVAIRASDAAANPVSAETTVGNAAGAARPGPAAARAPARPAPARPGP